MEQKTPLYEMHLKYQGKIVPFAGYLLPVQYKTGVIAEHMAVRNTAGLFDVSHMGEFLCYGKDALDNLNFMLTNDFTSMVDGQARYSVMCNERGGVVDDLIVYQYKEQSYFIVVNAANKDKDFAWMLDHQFGEVAFEDISSKVGQIALQGPKSKEILARVVQENMIPQKYYTCNFEGKIDEVKCMISRTGYTGEDGFELYMQAEKATEVWEILMEAGDSYGLIPCGLGARDTLRLEASMPLYGHEMNETITPLQAGLSFAVKMKKKNFIGKKALLERGEPEQKRVGLKVIGKGIVRENILLWKGGVQVGITTSGTYCPYVGKPIFMALVNKNEAEPHTVLEAEVRGKRIPCEVVPVPFYKRIDK